MTAPIRRATEADWPAISRNDLVAFGLTSLEAAEEWKDVLEFDRTWVALDGEAPVGCTSAYTFDVTVPGGRAVPTAGVTWVAVLPTHRRQGVLRSLMAVQLDEVAERGEPVAVLTASESLIYGRFGYGLATSALSVDIDTRHGAVLDTGEPSGRVRLAADDEPPKLLPTIYDAWRTGQPGAVSRNAVWWEKLLLDPERRRNGASPRFTAVHEDAAGRPDGYAGYRLKTGWTDGVPSGELRVEELVAPDARAATALWRFLLSVDLVRTVVAPRRPVDDPLRWQLADPRRLRVTGMFDHMWVRIVDVTAALAARTYATTGRLVLDVHDAFRPGTSGRYAVDGGPEGAEAGSTDGEADLELSIADLGAVYLGGVTFTTLAAAGRVRERTAGALARADAMFASTPAPYCNTDF